MMTPGNEFPGQGPERTNDNRRRLWPTLLAGVERTLDLGWRGWLVLALGVAAGWWLYVPLHELAHALGCLAAGGEVTRLEIAPEYGAAWLARWLPFVAVGSDYAGQLTGFDTGGHDGVYLATVLAPYLLTLFPGVPALLVCARRAGLAATAGFGASLPWALAPVLSLSGDYYEAGSILASRAGAALTDAGAVAVATWRSDDLFRLVAELAGRGALDGFNAVGIAAGLVLGILLALATLWLGTAIFHAMAKLAKP
ncbi:MAG: hypothetical protein AB7I68_08700 [Porticoccaceae bacterium]